MGKFPPIPTNSWSFGTDFNVLLMLSVKLQIALSIFSQL